MGRKGKGKAAKKAEVEDHDASADSQHPVPPSAADEPPATEVVAGTVNAPAPVEDTISESEVPSVEIEPPASDVENSTKPGNEEAAEPAQEAVVREDEIAERSGDAEGFDEGGHVAFSGAALSPESPTEHSHIEAAAARGQDALQGEGAGDEGGYQSPAEEAPAPERGFEPVSDDDSFHTDDEADESAQPSAAPGEAEDVEAHSGVAAAGAEKEEGEGELVGKEGEREVDEKLWGPGVVWRGGEGEGGYEQEGEEEEEEEERKPFEMDEDRVMAALGELPPDLDASYFPPTLTVAPNRKFSDLGFILWNPCR